MSGKRNSFRRTYMAGKISRARFFERVAVVAHETVKTVNEFRGRVMRGAYKVSAGISKI